MKVGLVLEGGGMRGLYTAGVLEALMRYAFQPEYVIGVSAGAGNGISFVSGQRGRNFRVNTAYLRDKRYISLSNFFHTRSVFGMDFVFEMIPRHLDPFDFEAFSCSKTAFVTGVTDLETGNPVYFPKQPNFSRQGRVLRASAAIPLFSPAVSIGDGLYVDGGTSDPIPVRKALKDGCDKVVVVLTRHRDYIKPPEKLKRLYHRAYREQPGLARALDQRHIVYNDTRCYLKELEKDGRAVVIAPSQPVTVGRFERDMEKLSALYRLGYRDTSAAWPAIRRMLQTA